MVKHLHAFTLLELLIALSITLLGLTFMIPSIGSVIQTQRLKYDVNRFKSVIENTRELSARSECDTEVTLSNQTPANNTPAQVRAAIQMIPSTQGECGTWFSSTGMAAYTNQFDLPGAQLQESPLRFRFAGQGSVVQQGLGQSVVFLRGGNQVLIQVRPEGFSTAQFAKLGTE